MLIYLTKNVYTIATQDINNNVYTELRNIAITTHPPDWYRANRMSAHKTMRNKDPIISALILYFLTIF